MLTSLTINCLLSTAGMYLRDINETDEEIVLVKKNTGCSKEDAMQHLHSLAKQANAMASTGTLSPTPTKRTSEYIAAMIDLGIELSSVITDSILMEI